MKVKNRDIIGAKTALAEMFQMKLPLRASLAVARLDTKLKEPIDVFVKVRDGLMARYEIERQPSTDGLVQFQSKQGQESLDKFLSEFNELLDSEIELVVDKVRLPEKIAATCDACKHNMDKQLEIEPSILAALEHFVEV